MKLYITAPSPFARKCRIVAREKGLSIEEVFVDPYANAPELLAANPVVQVPTLIALDGLPVNDSPVICEYLDSLGSGPRLLPADGAGRLRVRRLEVLADGLLEMGVKLVLEKRRPENERSPSWMTRWTENMHRCLDALEAADLSADDFHIGVLNTGVALT
jgi:glutathione S-transferase